MSGADIRADAGHGPVRIQIIVPFGREDTLRAVIHPAPSVSPFELQGTPQQWPGASSGIQSGIPARSEMRTIASGRLGPKIRLMQAGR